MEGPVLLGCLLVTHAGAALVGYLLGDGERTRRGRAEVLDATEQATGWHVRGLVPGQRDGHQ